MKIMLFFYKVLIFSFFYNFQLCAQKICICEHDKNLNEEVLLRNKAILENQKNKSCEIKELKNGNLLYYQFNCDSTWLTFQNQKTKNKEILFSKKNEYHINSYREGYKFCREFNNYILMYWHCSPICLYVLIDNQTGKQVDKIPNTLIFNSIDDNKKQTDFVVYFEDNTQNKFIIIHNLENNTKRTMKFPKNIKVNAVYPELECYKKIINNQNILILTFSNQSFEIDLTE